MKKVLCVLLCFMCFSFKFNTTACAKELSVSAQAYVLYCVENESVILSRNAEEKIKPASTTKIMTTLLALEEAQKRDVHVRFDDSMVAEGSSMYLKNGDVVHLSSLAKGMMMASGNDAANATALTLSDSIESFSDLMNKRAKEIGMKNTHFVTPSGLDDDNHYSTAFDMAKLMAHAMRNEAFCDITKNSSMTVDFLTPKKRVTYNNHNRLLSLYEYCIGGKTGYTKSAGRCLVSVARKDGVTLICATFDAPDDWNDHKNLYDYGFERLSAADVNDKDCDYSVEVVGGKKHSTPLYCKEKAHIVVNKEDIKRVKTTVYIPQFLYAPVRADDYVGEVVYKLDENVIARVELYTQNRVDISENSRINSFLEKIFK
jgi:D-alanyl-D-alanine carboxypeptidase/D-alanyl-D-alanine carboxypeptidase (penicillin-binding protein 5/6)